MAFANLPVFISLCVSWLRISIVVIHVVAGIGILESHQEKDQYAHSGILLPALYGIYESQIFWRERECDLHNC